MRREHGLFGECLFSLRDEQSDLLRRKHVQREPWLRQPGNRAEYLHDVRRRRYRLLSGGHLSAESRLRCKWCRGRRRKHRQRLQCVRRRGTDLLPACRWRRRRWHLYFGNEQMHPRSGYCARYLHRLRWLEPAVLRVWNRRDGNLRYWVRVRERSDSGRYLRGSHALTLSVRFSG